MRATHPLLAGEFSSVIPSDWPQRRWRSALGSRARSRGTLSSLALYRPTLKEIPEVTLGAAKHLCISGGPFSLFCQSGEFRICHSERLAAVRLAIRFGIARPGVEEP